MEEIVYFLRESPVYIQVQWDGLKTSPNNAPFYSQSILLKMHEECALDLPQPDYLIHPQPPC